jgi:CRP-like cAMP-binding protein
MAQPHQNCSIRNGLLLALSPEDLLLLRPKLQLVDLHFNDSIYLAGNRVDAVHFVETGMVSLIATLEDGSQVEVGIAGREGLFGLPLIFGDDRSIVEARVQLDGTALRIDAVAFRAAMEQSPTLRGLLLRYAMAFHAQVTFTAACNARHAIENRLARWLLIAHDRAGGDSFAITHEFISMMLGVGRPGVSIAAGILQKAGLVHYGRGKMNILDRSGLEAATCECYHSTRREFARLLGSKDAQSPG